jgi:hypothetical protein
VSSPSRSGQVSLERDWTVTPEQPGPVNLVFAVNVSTTAGDRELSKAVFVHRSVRADPKPPSLWSRLQAPVLWITPFVALIAAILGVRAIWWKRGDTEPAADLSVPGDSQPPQIGDSQPPADGDP